MMHKCDINITTTKIAQKDYVCLLVNCLDTIQDYDIAKALHNKYGNRFICALPKKNIWYELVNNKWCLSENGTSLMRLINEDFTNDFLRLASELTLKAINLNGSEKEYAKNKAHETQKICNRLLNITFKKQIMKHATYIFYKEDFYEINITEKRIIPKCDINITTTKIVKKDYKYEWFAIELDTNQDYDVYDITKALHNKYGDRFICALPKKNIWYELINNKWCLSENGTSLMRLISEDFSNGFLRLAAELNLKAINLNGSEKEDAKNKACKTQKICDKLVNITFKKQIMKHATDIFYKEDFYEINIAEKKHQKYKKKLIPPPLKRNVWHKYIGEDIGKAKCLCCKLADITQMSFHCGHIIAESKGGELSVNNLKPICQSCNSSMGTQNMDEYIEKYGF
jgi:frataxin-like iron-binding protein CyaY